LILINVFWACCRESLSVEWDILEAEEGILGFIMKEFIGRVEGRSVEQVTLGPKVWGNDPSSMRWRRPCTAEILGIEESWTLIQVSLLLSDVGSPA
jgi:hypothetical protein